jgi:hypothetical protein
MGKKSMLRWVMTFKGYVNVHAFFVQNWMKKFMPDRQKANELENTITSVTDPSEDGVAGAW